MISERLKPLLDDVAPVAEVFAAANHRLYLVGGPVRDALAGRPDATDLSSLDVDIDLTTDALPDEIESLISPLADAVWTQGKRFGTVGMERAKRRFEITTHRGEKYEPSSRKPEVTFGHDIAVDLSRRDFTVNAMALSLPDLELVDPFDGFGDLIERRVLRTPGSPESSFSDDPLRMLRAARLIAGWGLVPDAGLVDAATAMSSRLSVVAPERIADELDKLLALPDPSEGLWYTVRTGVLRQFLPEIPALELEQDPIQRHKDVLAHTIAVVAQTRPDRVLRLAALLHDIGKPKTRAYVDGGVTFHHHDVVGARMARNRLSALRYSNDVIADVSELVALHLRFHTYSMGWSDSALRRYASDAGPLLGRLNELTRADCTTRNPRKVQELSDRMDELERRLDALREREAIDAIRPELDGSQVMEVLDIPPGPMVGRALGFLLEIRMEEGIVGHDEVVGRLRSWW
ncbi:MAG TPA: CCA tRNA nucleotidyltransferase, partial [Acidimicrobiales bacterium]|nr:CCA tRNA nucleotidyltransferase [Acidimicrobiales bacterium]